MIAFMPMTMVCIVIGRDIEGPRIDLGMSLKGPIMKKDGTPLSLGGCGGEVFLIEDFVETDKHLLMGL